MFLSIFPVRQQAIHYFLIIITCNSTWVSVILHVDACLSIQLLLHVYFCLVGCAFAGVYFSRAIGIDFIITNSNKVQRRVSSYTEESHVSEIDCKSAGSKIVISMFKCQKIHNVNIYLIDVDIFISYNTHA